MNNKNVLFTFIIACLMSAVVAGCNVFSFLHPETAATGASAIDEHIAQGRKLLNLGQNAAAAIEFQYAIDIGTNSTPMDRVTDAYYYHAVAYSRSKDVDALGIMLNIVAAMAASSDTGLLGSLESSDLADIKDATGVSRSDLWAVYTSSSADPPFRSIEINRETVYFDLTMSATLNAVSTMATIASGLSFTGSSITWADNGAAWAVLTAGEKAALIAEATDSMDAATTVMDDLYGTDSNSVKDAITGVDGFFDGL